jgi:hypothetical protein
MSEHSTVQRSIGAGPAVGRRTLLQRATLLGLGGAALAASLAIGTAPSALAQGYAPPPPPPYAEPMPQPRDRYVWEAGHWRWNGYKYIWFKGHWIPNGPPGSHFVPGYWKDVNGQSVWVEAHWKYD